MELQQIFSIEIHAPNHYHGRFFKRAAAAYSSHPDFLCKVGFVRKHLKKRILIQDQGGHEFQIAPTTGSSSGIRWYAGDLKFMSNTDIGAKDFFEMACNYSPLRNSLCTTHFPEKGSSPAKHCACGARRMENAPGDVLLVRCPIL